MSFGTTGSEDREVRARDRRMLLAATRLALRGRGRVEPNPLVGCVLACGDEVVGCGHHRVFGGPHAEREALADFRRRFPDLATRLAGARAAGALCRDVCVTAYVTLEPCAHHGKTPPCADALIEAGVHEVVIARRDSHAVASGGAGLLESAGVRVRFTDVCPEAQRLSDPFFVRVHEGRPWVIAKWAQSIDGKIATRTGESQWISCESSRRRVHVLRGRVDAVMTGIGTVLADDPLLTSRVVGVDGLFVRPRRVAKRVVVDALLRTPVDCKLIRSIGETGGGAAGVAVIIAHAPCGDDAARARAALLRSSGAVLMETSVVGKSVAGEPMLDLSAVLRSLHTDHGVSTVLTEAGPGLVGGLLRADVVDELMVFVAPLLFADGKAMGPADGGELARLADAKRWAWADVRWSGVDTLLCARRVGR